MLKRRVNFMLFLLSGIVLCGVTGCGVSSDGSSSSSAISSSSTVNSSVTSSSAMSSSAEPEPTGQFVLALNAGGSVAELNGLTYIADRFFRGGTANQTDQAITGSEGNSIYQTERYGSLTYEIPVTNADYVVELQFVEMYQTEAQARIFSAELEGVSILTGVDLYDTVGAFSAYQKRFSTTVDDGSLSLELFSEVDNATVSGIVIYSTNGGEYVEPPVPELGEVRPSAGCSSARSLNNGRINLSVGGANRSYILRVPDSYDSSKPYRLVMAYHWLNGSANQVANGGMGGSTDDPFYGLWDLAENSTIFVAPEGIDAGWANTGGRDLQFTDAILDAVLGDLCIDESRIFATGFSYGAAMSNALSCARADVFRGVALYAGAQLSGCEGGSAPIAYFGAHGLSDSVLNISSGRSVRDRIARNNGCSVVNLPEPAVGSGTHTCSSYENCMEGYPVRWCAFDGDHNPTQKDRGQSRSWVPGEAWNFISQF